MTSQQGILTAAGRRGRRGSRGSRGSVKVSPALYEGVTGHYRLQPTEHAFERPVRMVMIDVDDPRALDEFPFWSGTRRALKRFEATDHLDGTHSALGPAIRDLVEQRLGIRPTGPVTLLTQPRTWGYVFNPLSIYYCWDSNAERVIALVLEVTNTPWKERHTYVVDARDSGATDTVRTVEMSKELHVSPFMPMNQTYRFAWQDPGASLFFSITLVQDGQRVFSADLDLRERELNRSTARRAAWSRPWSTLAVTAGIHVEAFKLWRKKVPFHKHPKLQSETDQIAEPDLEMAA